MQSDKYAMAEKILRDVESVINRDAELKEFGIIPVNLNQNKSPVIHVEHNLGLESWCVKHVYSYAYQKGLEARKLVQKRKLLNEEYGNVNRIILGALLINPDVATFWNMRRELVTENYLHINHELKIAKIVLSHKHKSNEAFSYRKWLLRRVLASEILDKSNLYSLLNEELKVCNLTALKSPNNYHAWCHRIWCLENVLKVSSDEVRKTVLVSELCYSETWVTKHISEHTGVHYREYILNRILNLDINLENKYHHCFNQFYHINTNANEMLLHLFGHQHELSNALNARLCKNIVILTYDLVLNTELNTLYPEHETLWYHRRFILHTLFSLVYKYFHTSLLDSTNLDLVFTSERECNVLDDLINSTLYNKESGEKLPKMPKSDQNSIDSTLMYKLLVANEKTLVEKFAKLNNRHGYLAQRHEKWLIYVLGLSDG